MKSLESPSVSFRLMIRNSARGLRSGYLRLLWGMAILPCASHEACGAEHAPSRGRVRPIRGPGDCRAERGALDPRILRAWHVGGTTSHGAERTFEDQCVGGCRRRHRACRHAAWLRRPARHCGAVFVRRPGGVCGHSPNPLPLSRRLHPQGQRAEIPIGPRNPSVLYLLTCSLVSILPISRIISKFKVYKQHTATTPLGAMFSLNAW